jgi:hypothetical protein
MIVGQDFIDFANGLFSTTCNEVTCRALIGRYYYGAFLMARSHANLNHSSANEHKALIDHYNGIDFTLSNDLDKLRKLRTRSDYFLDDNVTYHQMNDSKRIAGKVVKNIQNKILTGQKTTPK